MTLRRPRLISSLNAKAVAFACLLFTRTSRQRADSLSAMIALQYARSHPQPAIRNQPRSDSLTPLNSHLIPQTRVPRTVVHLVSLIIIHCTCALHSVEEDASPQSEWALLRLWRPRPSTSPSKQNATCKAQRLVINSKASLASTDTHARPRPHSHHSPMLLPQSRTHSLILSVRTPVVHTRISSGTGEFTVMMTFKVYMTNAPHSVIA
ncbi:unnamed protein product [Protopolystoma xenopodis]|uniref:Uncharacterized protein n=1 Tax=Protopolystoma xenopodis TaxID=117903 RepID=A0A3S4ZIA8_9PLAT|nr:unnamed protein product [Protopolystoma xenopodis]